MALVICGHLLHSLTVALRWEGHGLLKVVKQLVQRLKRLHLVTPGGERGCVEA